MQPSVLSQTGHPLQSNHLYLKRALLKMVGAKFHIHDAASGQEVMVAEQKGFKLKEDIRISVNGREEIGIFARQVMDFKGAYDVVDLTVQPNVRIGVLKRKGWKSMIRDEWVVCDAHEREAGIMIEDQIHLALIRRFLTNLVPQDFDMLIGGAKVMDLKQNFNPFTYHLNLYFMVPPEQFDRRLGVAAAVLLAAIEGRQG